MVENAQSEQDASDQRIWALLSGLPVPTSSGFGPQAGGMHEPHDIKEVARLLNDEFVPRVMGVLKKLGVDEITREEIAKEAVDRAVKAYKPGRAKFLTFVTRIALNIRVDRFRQGSLLGQTVEPLDDSKLSVQEGSENALDLLDPAEESGFVKRVRAIFPQLRQEDQLLIQFDIQGVPKDSYMDLFGIGKAAYRQRKSRAYRRLKEVYNKQYPERRR